MPDPMVDSPKVAVLLAAYNGINWISEQLGSILSQRNIEVTVFISVDLSSDATYEWCVQLQNTINNLTVLPYGERFGGAAKNFFRLFRDVDFSGFDYIALADQDDIWHKNKIYESIYHIKLVGTDAYSGNVIAFWEDGTRQLINKAQPQRELDYLFEAAGPGCTYVVTHDLAIAFQKFLRDTPKANEIILHDWLLYAFSRSQGYQWFIDTVPRMEYRQHSCNQVGVNKSLASFLKRVRYIIFGGGMLQVKTLLSILPENNDFQKYKALSRKKIFRLLLVCNQLRRRPLERLYVFIALSIALAVGVKDR